MNSGSMSWDGLTDTRPQMYKEVSAQKQKNKEKLYFRPQTPWPAKSPSTRPEDYNKTNSLRYQMFLKLNLLYNINAR